MTCIRLQIYNQNNKNDYMTILTPNLSKNGHFKKIFVFLACKYQT